MASTNKTTHYDLSQYVGSDKPTYLTDYNGDMASIDTGIYNAQTKADSGYTLASSADTKADTAITNAGIAQTNASTALTNIGTMANLETTEKSSLVGAINENKRNIDNFNLTNFYNINTADISVANGTLSSSTLKVATNSDGSIAKVYGYVSVSNVTGAVKVSFPTVLRPTSEFNVECTVMGIGYYAGSVLYPTVSGMTFKTTGVVEIDLYQGTGGITNINGYAIPVVIWVKDFGDTPTPQN